MIKTWDGGYYPCSPKWIRDGIWGVYRDGDRVVVCQSEDSALRIARFHSDTENGNHSWSIRNITSEVL